MALSPSLRMSLAHNLRKPVTLTVVAPPTFAGWTDATTERLRELLAAGMSASRAARELGCTRNAVIGKARREGIAFTTPGAGGKGRDKTDTERFAVYQARLAREREARARATAERRERSAARRTANAAPAEHIAREPAPICIGPREPMTLPDIRFRPGRMCRWPVGEVEGERGRHLFCAADVPAFGDVYCAEHARQARATAADMAARRAAAEKFKDEAERAGRKAFAQAGRRANNALFV